MDRLKHIIQLNILLGAWLAVSPFVLGYAGSRSQMANDVALGVVLLGCSWWMLAAGVERVGLAVLQLLAGLWLVAAPFVVPYAELSRPFDNDIAVGIVAVLASAWTIWLFERMQRRTA
jgi:hypothetical protein